MSGDSEGFWGSVWVKYGNIGGDGSYGDNLNYRARLGWKGSVTDDIVWGGGYLFTG